MSYNKTEFKRLMLVEVRRSELIVGGIYFLLLLQALLLFTDRGLLWGIDNVMYRFGHTDRFIENTVLRLYYQPGLFAWIYYGHLMACGAALLSFRLVFIPRIIAWFTGLMLYHAAPAAYSEAMPLLLNMAVIASFYHSSASSRLINTVNYWIPIMLRIQSLIVVTTFLLYAFGSVQWPGGSAVYYHLHHNSLICAQGYRQLLTKFSTSLTYGLLAYAITFISLVGFVRTRRIIINIGIIISCSYVALSCQLMNGLVCILMLLTWTLTANNHGNDGVAIEL